MLPDLREQLAFLIGGLPGLVEPIIESVIDAVSYGDDKALELTGETFRKLSGAPSDNSKLDAWREALRKEYKTRHAAKEAATGPFAWVVSELHAVSFDDLAYAGEGSRDPSSLLPGLDAAEMPVSGVSHKDSAAIAEVQRSGGSLSDAFRLGLRDVTAQPATVVEPQKPRR